MHQFSILTPTFNRAKYLPKLYECLCKQDNVDFEWIIVDDGSTDNTKEIVSGFEKIFPIKYHYQQNTGKPSAMNAGIRLADSYITLVSLDDEDSLIPNALKTAWSFFDSKTGRFNHDCASLSGLCQYENGTIIGKEFPQNNFTSDYINYIKNKNITGDKCVFYVSDVLKNYSYPIFENEKNIAPSILHIKIALTYKTLFINQILQEKQFLLGGLSSKNYWLMYPLGSELYYNEASIPPFSLKLQIKHSGEYIFYAKINKRKTIFRHAKNKKIFPLGLLAYLFFCIKRFFKKSKFLQKINDDLKKTIEGKNQHKQIKG